MKDDGPGFFWQGLPGNIALRFDGSDQATAFADQVRELNLNLLLRP